MTISSQSPTWDGAVAVGQLLIPPTTTNANHLEREVMTKRLNLMLHCGAQAVEPEQLDHVELPPIKRNERGHITYQPVSHGAVRAEIHRALNGQGLEGPVVVAEAQGMTEDGQRAFGMIQVDVDRLDVAKQKTGLIVGWRNSHDQKFASALAMGAGVFVCDNLSFSGEVRVTRRHTRFIRRDLPGVISNAVGKLLAARHHQQRLFEAMEQTQLGRYRLNDTLVESMRVGAIPNASIPKVLAEYESDHHREMHGGGTAWSLFNAFTEVSKKDPVTTAMKRTQKLHGVFGSLCGLAS